MRELGLREQKKQQTRAALFEAAMRLFQEKGYANTTVAEIAAEAGVSTKTLFNYFSGKEDVLFAHRMRRIDTLEDAFRARLADDAPPQALRLIALDLLDWLSSGEEPRGEVNLAQAKLIMSVPELRGRSQALLYEAENRLASVLHEAAPWLDPITAGSAVGALIGAMQGAARAGIARGDSLPDIVGSAQIGIDLVTRGLDQLAQS
ncbi:hypothetical protein BAY61_08770 [Prauserella marina]|uniref:DNA-binding transcriptional regulator, AcrR family n=1 Tax=Prauserella marina TaxID=530584 RepID=A0A222VMF6_9PSEU|nr:TetR/AcrR family transcriptional regulator [Prauserella marina]ASR35057.1 hypothetical protein BAY61_08770 [Prauserella marina]PWV85201.1 TetR family transcriptional regulator [Prauserella marina]SDC02493.1 DNA-binding transcriptional regulator, AcrR family [Prauserella marina]